MHIQTSEYTKFGMALVWKSYRGNCLGRSLRSLVFALAFQFFAKVWGAEDLAKHSGMFFEGALVRML